ncbi:uncharacterized protein LY89DRAFT_191920 [Mollisia scopiformis]|uniref:Uncharacterized protein n=1 Tax=Mollisia scopiformis TaxID=149040 RepID=A0A194WXU7_MOLSC|nr:uncharacterized protein LY89DRAFT_191920 [Mollisia scopiformis]KUJ12755.1 hypothetical protein LY89DRAFT_191920 [Mollisia scopiformis]
MVEDQINESVKRLLFHLMSKIGIKRRTFWMLVVGMCGVYFSGTDRSTELTLRWTTQTLIVTHVFGHDQEWALISRHAPCGEPGNACSSVLSIDGLSEVLSLGSSLALIRDFTCIHVEDRRIQRIYGAISAQPCPVLPSCRCRNLQRLISGHLQKFKRRLESNWESNIKQIDAAAQITTTTASNYAFGNMAEKSNRLTWRRPIRLGVPRCWDFASGHDLKIDTGGIFGVRLKGLRLGSWDIGCSDGVRNCWDEGVTSCLFRVGN